MSNRLRIFLSSPGDVGEERLRAHLVIQKLARDYARFFKIEPYLWEHEPMLASGHFQDAIEPPSACDVVVLIVYSRLGTSLPEKTAVREYHGIDGRAPVTGTEWEFEDALGAFRSRGAPDLLAYRKVGDPGASLADPARRAEQERQWDALQAFWRRHFENGGMFLAGSAQFRTLDEFDRKLEAHLTALIEKKIAEGLADVGNEAPHWLRGSPFRGLAAYEFEDAPVFFGRDAPTRAALTRLQAAAERGCAFLLVLGASGSGKSSLARAGVLPGLFGPKAIPGVGVWRRVVFRPGDGGLEPVAGLARAIATGDPEARVGLPEIVGTGAGWEALATHLAAAPDDPSFPFRVVLDRIAEDARARGLLPHETARLVILADQLEELFTATIEPARRELFLRVLAGLARSGLVWVVATMRNDLWHHVARAPILLNLVEDGARLDLVQPDGSEIIEIIRRPAKAAGLRFETASDTGVGLDAVMAKAAAEEPGALPLLSVMLDTLYERDVKVPSDAGRPVHALTFATYRELGELRGAIAQRADEVLRGIERTDPAAAAALPLVLRTLVTAAGAEKVASRPARLDAFPPGTPESRLIQAFLAPDARLLVSSDAETHAEVRLAHEALLENWPAARDQIARDRRDLQTRARLEALERRWAAASGPERRTALLTGLNLAEGVDLVRRWRLDAASGLGLFVAASQRADRLRRNRFVGIAAALALLFAGIAAAAGLQWTRAERQAVAARNAAEAERDARSAAERDRAEAERQRERAGEERSRAEKSEQRAVTALRDTQREVARSLAVEAELAAGQKDVRRSLTLAIKAANAERDALNPGEAAASVPALLQAMADVREVLQVRGSPKSWAMPYDFYGDKMLAYAESESGLVVADLAPSPRVAVHAKLPEGQTPTQIRSLASSNLVAVAAGRHLVLVDARDGRIAADLTFPTLITALDVHEPTRQIAVAVGAAVALVPLDDPRPEVVPVPNARSGMNVAQVRFGADGRTLFATYGVAVLSLDVATRRFAEAPLTELDASAIGLGKQAHEDALQKGRGVVSIVTMHPDPTRPRILFRSNLSLTAFDPATGATTGFDRASDTDVLGVGFADQARTGARNEAVAVLGRRGNTQQEFELVYVSDDGKLLPFDNFAIPAGDLNGEKVKSCRVSLNLSHLACEYWGDIDQGIAVWRLLGGAHRFERLLAMRGTSGVFAAERGDGDPHVILATNDAITAVHLGHGTPVETRLAAIPAGWRLTAAKGPYLVAATEPAGRVQIWRQEGDQPARPALGPLDARDALVHPASNLAILREASRLVAYDLEAGTQRWALPGLEGLQAAALSADGQRVAAVTREGAYLFGAAGGRLLATMPIEAAEAPAAWIAPDAAALAYVDRAGTARVLDFGSQAESALANACKAAQIAWSPDGVMILLGCRNGSVLAFDRAGQERWQIPSPLGAAFSEGVSWPGQPPKGLVLGLAFSPDARRVAIVRQDLAALAIHDAENGRALTELTTPWSYGVPAAVKLGPDGLVLTVWAVHAMARGKPREVTVHRLPVTFEGALSAAEARLAALRDIWTPEGPARRAEQRRSDLP